MIRKDFEWCSVHTRDDLQIAGIDLTLSDCDGDRLQVRGQLYVGATIDPNSEAYMQILGKVYVLVFSGTKITRTAVGQRVSVDFSAGYMPGGLPC